MERISLYRTLLLIGEGTTLENQNVVSQHARYLI